MLALLLLLLLYCGSSSGHNLTSDRGAAEIDCTFNEEDISLFFSELGGFLHHDNSICSSSMCSFIKQTITYLPLTQKFVFCQKTTKSHNPVGFYQLSSQILPLERRGPETPTASNGPRSSPRHTDSVVGNRRQEKRKEQRGKLNDGRRRGKRRNIIFFYSRTLGQ